MKSLRLFIFTCFSIFGSMPMANADPAKFWFSLADSANVAPIAPEAPEFSLPQGGTRYLYVWARPETVGSGAYNAATNPFRVLQNFSLNVTVESYVDFLDGMITVYNPMVGGLPRFHFTSDSASPTGCGQTSPPSCLTSNATASQVAGGTADWIGRPKTARDWIGIPKTAGDIQGFSFSTSGSVGLGHLDDPFRAVTSGVPSWLVASVAVQMSQASGVSRGHLQIGYNGMLQQGDAGSEGTDVVFGFDPGGSEPTYNAATERQSLPKPGDDPDFTITAIPSLPGDYNGDGAVGPQDYMLWKSTFGQSVTSGNGADGNGNSLIDAADYVFWRHQAASGTGASVLSVDLQQTSDRFAVPEPCCATSVVLAILLFSLSRFGVRL